jgi:hypothetical protein
MSMCTANSQFNLVKCFRYPCRQRHGGLYTACNCICKINIDATEYFGLTWDVPRSNLDRDTDHLARALSWYYSLSPVSSVTVDLPQSRHRPLPDKNHKYEKRIPYFVSIHMPVQRWGAKRWKAENEMVSCLLREGDIWVCSNGGMFISKGEPKKLLENHAAVLFYPTQTSRGVMTELTPDLRGENPESNRRSYDTDYY